MSTYKVPTDGELAYADEITIDEAGIDLRIDGETELGASFEGIDPYALALDVLPEDYDLPEDTTKEMVEQHINQWVLTYGNTEDEDTKLEAVLSLEMAARVFLSALAAIRKIEAAK